MNTATPETIGNFRILGKLGQGGMGAVYRAVHETLERTVALKILPGEFANNPEYVMRFLREARTIATLRHENIVQVYDAGEQGGQYFIAMELVEGSNLGTFTDEHKPVSEKEGIELMLQAARGLAAAHDKGLVHRDIKPENLLLGKDNVLRLVDFGLVMESTSTTQLTATGACLGTPMYMSPEQADGENADARTDIYSLGVTFFRVFTGETPFSSPTVMNLLFKHKFEAPPEPKAMRPDLSQNVSNLLLHMLAKRREDRPQTAQKLMEMIELVKQRKTIPPPPRFVPIPAMSGATDVTQVSAALPRPETPRRAPFLGLAVIAVLLALFAGVWYFLNRLPADGSASADAPRPANAEDTAKTDPAPGATPADDAIARGDHAFAAANLISARDEYKLGLALDPRNETLLARVKKTDAAISYKAAMDAGTALEANGQWEDAAKQYAAARQYGDGAQARLDAVNLKLVESRKLEASGKNIARDAEIRKADEAEKSFRYDIAAEHYSRAATLSEPALRTALADKAQECRRQDYIAQGKAAEALMDFADAEAKYRKALAIKDDPLVAEKVDMLHKKAPPPATLSAPDKPAPDKEKEHRDAMAAARAALSSGNFTLARQKLEIARKAGPTQGDTAALAREIEGRDSMQQADAAKTAGDRAQAAGLYKRALAACPELQNEITPKLNAVLTSLTPPAAVTDSIDSKVHDFKDDEATTELANALRADPNNTQLQKVRDSLEDMRYGWWIYHELSGMLDKARAAASDAIDIDDDKENVTERNRLKKIYDDDAEKERRIRQLFSSHDYNGVHEMLAAARADAADDSAKLTAGVNYFEARAEKADKGFKMPFGGPHFGDSKKANKYRRIADDFRKYAEQAKNLRKYGER